MDGLAAAAGNAVAICDGDAKVLARGGHDAVFTGEPKVLPDNVAALGECDQFGWSCMLYRHADVEMRKPEVALAGEFTVDALVHCNGALIAVARVRSSRLVRAPSL
jgi:hypothetical protein